MPWSVLALFMLVAPKLAEMFGLKPNEPFMPGLLIPIPTRVQPTRRSLIIVDVKVCVSPKVIPRELPNSSPAPKPEGRSLLVGELPGGKLFSRIREFLDRL